MSVLIIGGDRVSSIKKLLIQSGVEKIIHFDGRKNPKFKSLPKSIDYIFILVDKINHSMMKKFKNRAKKENIPVVYTHSCLSCFDRNFCKISDRDSCLFRRREG